MAPTLRPGEIVLADRYSRGRQPQVGDVVLARAPGTGLAIIKRIVAGPGHEVVGHPSGCWVNGQWRGNGIEPPSGPPVDSHHCGPGQFFLMGDDPSHSTDSRSFGPLDASAIEARLWLVAWPPARLRPLGSGGDQRPRSHQRTGQV